MLAAESPPSNQKNQPYDAQEMPEELKRLQDKNIGLESLIDNIQK